MKATQRGRLFTGILGLLSLTIMGSPLPAHADGHVYLSKPEVSRNGAVHTHAYGLKGDPDGWYSKFSFAVFQGAKRVKWDNAARLAPGKYRMTVSVRLRWRAIRQSMPEARLWQSKNHLKRGWSYTIAPPEISTQYVEEPWILPAEVVYNGDTTRLDPPIHRYYLARYSETCGFPFFACYAYIDEKGIRQEIPADQAQILDLTKVPGSGYYGWRPENLWPYAGLLSPTGTQWVYQEQRGSRSVAGTYTATATTTYRHPAIGATYVSTMSRATEAVEWGSPDRYKDWLMGLHDPYGLGTVTLTQSPKRRLGKASVLFRVKPAPARRPPHPTDPPSTGVYYENCTDARNHGAAPLYKGDPGYGPHLDRDGDGVACEYWAP